MVTRRLDKPETIKIGFKTVEVTEAAYHRFVVWIECGSYIGYLYLNNPCIALAGSPAALLVADVEDATMFSELPEAEAALRQYANSF